MDRDDWYLMLSITIHTFQKSPYCSEIIAWGFFLCFVLFGFLLVLFLVYFYFVLFSSLFQ